MAPSQQQLYVVPEKRYSATHNSFPSKTTTFRGGVLRHLTPGKPALHCKENPIYVFLFWELRGLSPNFHIHVSVIDLYIPRISPHISCSRIGRSIVGNI